MPDRSWDLPAIAPRVEAMMKRWADHALSERASLQPFILELCAALGVDPPSPSGAGEFQFELPVQVTDRDGKSTTNFVDCWKRGHFALEGKATGADVPDHVRLRKAFGQVRNYVAHVSGDAPPYLMVLDVPRHLMIWDRWSGSYGDFSAGKRIDLTTLHTQPEQIALLCDIFEQPEARDPRAKAQLVTQEIAAKLAELSATLESRLGDSERVARFLMRCVFSCFAEDVGLLPKGLFERTLRTAREDGGPSEVGESLTLLWRTMDAGGRFGAERVQRFNGHFFKTVEALPLEAHEVDLLIEAAHFDWSRVEPSIFGTLLVRALDSEERHRLGAEYTPRAYIERLVEPTVVEPIREKWTAVQAAVVQLEGTGRKKDREGALKELRSFHEWMRGLRFLDPACGSGNFLYVTMAAVKRIELEVLNEIDRVSGGQGGLVLEEVHPRQFHGIEIKPWAREIAELTLWIGYHQFWRETHGGRTPPIPILEDTGTLECRDAVLAWDEIVHRPEKDRPDPTLRIAHPVTGELVPDPKAKLPYYEYVNPRPAEWPRADFIVGNPPYLGQARQREAFGDGYVEALRAAYPDLPDGIDLVMYWWFACSQRVGRRECQRAGLITTNSIVQPQNRKTVELAAALGAFVRWAISDHPWVEGSGGAAVRVAMTVQSAPAGTATLQRVTADGALETATYVKRLNTDLTATADVAGSSSVSLIANQGLCSDGVKLHGRGFLLSNQEASAILGRQPASEAVIRRYLNGRDIAQKSRHLWVVDFATRDEEEAKGFIEPYQLVRDRVKPERDANSDRRTRERWWLFGRNREEFRPSLAGLTQYIVTVDTARHRYFVFVSSDVVVDDKLVAISANEAWILGVLSSHIHIAWSDAAGTRLGVGNDPVYLKSRCFDAFPFPVPSTQSKCLIAMVAENVDAHRKQVLRADERVTMTGIYNVIEKLRSGTPLTPKEREIHELAACGVLKDLHDELDAKVAEAYGWPWPMEREEILERLVALHDERVEEEKRGIIRWLRPEYQIPRFAPAGAAAAELALPTAPQTKTAPPERRAWPTSAVEQLAAVSASIAHAPRSIDEVAALFTRADPALVARHLETLAIMGEIMRDADGRFAAPRKVA